MGDKKLNIDGIKPVMIFGIFMICIIMLSIMPNLFIGPRSKPVQPKLQLTKSTVVRVTPVVGEPGAYILDRKSVV